MSQGDAQKQGKPTGYTGALACLTPQEAICGNEAGEGACVPRIL
jgi:hypothetical protein